MISISEKIKGEILEILRKRKQMKDEGRLNADELNLPMRDIDDDSELTQAEIDSIEEIMTANLKPGDLQGIELLKNLKSLKLQWIGEKELLIDYYNPNEDRVSRLSDADVKIISSLTNLRKLTISGQVGIKELDVSNLVNLHQLTVTENPYLESITGLQNLEKLKKLEIFSNSRLFSINELNSVIVKNPLESLNLDALYYMDAIRYNMETGKADGKAYRKIQMLGSKAGWKENVGSGMTHTMTSANMHKVHMKAVQILRDYVSSKQTGDELQDMLRSIIGVESYLATNVRTDPKGDETKFHYDENGNKMGQMYGPNSMFNTLMYNSAICGGYTHAMQYLLKLKGIKSRNVYCLIDNKFKTSDTLHMADPSVEGTSRDLIRLCRDKKKEGISIGGHSIICIEEKWYSDVLADAVAYKSKREDMPFLPLALKTKSQIEKNHVLTFTEREVEYLQDTISRDYINSLVDQNDYYLKSDTKDLDDEKRELITKEKNNNIIAPVPEEEKERFKLYPNKEEKNITLHKIDKIIDSRHHSEYRVDVRREEL